MSRLSRLIWKKQRERKKDKEKKKEVRAAKKAKHHDSQDGQDQEMSYGSGGLRDLAPDAEGVDVVLPLVVDPVLVGIVADKSGT